MHKQQFTKEAGAREGVPSLAILITDGVPFPDTGDLPVKYAEAARADGIKIISIGITANVDKEQVIQRGVFLFVCECVCVGTYV